MKNLTAYWLNGTPYCIECAEHDLAPCMSEAERRRSIREPGQGRCGCCGLFFEAESEACQE